MQKEFSLYERYGRQMLLPQLGESGQQKLLRSKVLVIGAGGLGCPVLQYLAAAGVGTIGIVDDDVVALHNLHRQILFASDDVGVSKAVAAAVALQKLNPGIAIIPYNERLSTLNALRLIDQYDIVVDGTDNFSTRYLVSDACVLMNKPLVYGAISQFEGQVALFNVQREKRSVNYRDLFPEPPAAGEVLSCAEAGVIGVLPGIIGTMQATEVIKLITGIGEPLVNRLFTYNALNNQSYTINLQTRESTITQMPFDADEFSTMDYDWFCSVHAPVEEIDAILFEQFTMRDDVLIIDVRENEEQPFVTEFEHRLLPLSSLRKQPPVIENSVVVLFCQSGKRSLQAAEILSKYSAARLYSLKGGIIAWKVYQSTKTPV